MAQKSILVIDDDQATREFLRYHLSREGYEIFECADGEQALQMMTDLQVDLAIVDIFMPNQDGLTTIRYIKKDYPQVLIFAISGGGELLPGSDYLEHAQRFGATKSFEKPLKIEAIIREIKERL